MIGQPRGLILASFFALLLLTPFSAFAANLVTNGDLEVANATTPSLPLGWDQDSWGTLTAVFTYPVAGFNSAKAAQVTLSKYTSGDAKWYFTHISVTPGTTYQVSENFKSTVATEVDAEFLLSNGTYSYVVLGSPASTANAWSNFTGSVVAPATAKTMSILHLISKVGTLVTDNMQVSSGTTPPPPVPTCTLSANPTSVLVGSSSILSFGSTNATNASINNGIGPVATSGTQTVTPSATTTYVGTFSGTGGTTTCSAQVIVTTPPPPPVQKPVITSFVATPSSIAQGSSTLLSWSVTDASTTSIDQGIGIVGTSTYGVSPTATTTYTLTATNPGGSVTATVTVFVVLPPPPPPPPAPTPVINSFTATPQNITSGQTSTLGWSLSSTSSFAVFADSIIVAQSGSSLVVSPTATTTYTLYAYNGGTATTSATVGVGVTDAPPPPAKPVINSFGATPSAIQTGQSSTLSWSVTGASTTLSIDQGIGVVTGTSKVVSPVATTTYTLTASNSGGTSTSSVTVGVTTPPPPPTNLVVNGNLESGTTGAPQGWGNDYWGSMNAKFTYPVTGNGGGKAAQIIVSNYKSGAANWAFNHIQSNSHTMYQFTEDYLATAATEIDIEFLMSDGSYRYEWLSNVPASSSWKTFTGQITVPPGAVSFSVLHLMIHNGTLTIDNAAAAPIATTFSQGMVTLAFDDGLSSQYTQALPMLTSAALKGSFYIITTEPTSGDSGYMTWAQVKDLATKGHEVGGHTRTHPALTTLTTTQAQQEIQGSFNDLVAQGLPPKTFVYPLGDVNQAVENQVKAAGYLAARGSYFGDNVPQTDRYDLYDIRLDATSNLADVKSYIDQAKADKRWIVFELHDVKTGGDSYAITPSFFQSVVTYLKQTGVAVVTMQDGMQLLNP